MKKRKTTSLMMLFAGRLEPQLSDTPLFSCTRTNASGTIRSNQRIS